MTATFGCPYCGATYPVKPVLIGRPVRCTACRNAFRLRADGIADKVDAGASEAAPAAAAASTAHATTIPTPPPATPTSKPATTRTGARPAPRRDAAAHENARRELAANLSTIAEQALRVEEQKQAADHLRRQSDRLVRQQTAATREGAGIAPVVLTGSGQREHRDRRRWTLGCLAVIAVIALVVTLPRALRSDERRALIAFTEPVGAGFPRRRGLIIERAWLTTVAPMVDMHDARIGRRRAIALAGAQPVIASLQGLQLYPDKAVWAKPASEGELARRWDAGKPPRANLEALEHSTGMLANDTVLARLAEAGLEAADAELLLRLLGTATTAAGDDVRKRLAAGEMPHAMELATFSGADGALLVDYGGTYRTRSVAYEGQLLRFVGSGWPEQWRIVELHTRIDP